MHSRSLINTFAAASVGFVVLSSGAAAQKSTKEQIQGTWNIVSQIQTMPDGTIRHPAGEKPKGVNVFTPDGRFVVLFMRNDLPKFAGGERAKATVEEARAIVTGSVSYYGSYDVDEGNKTIIFKLEASTFPNQLGIDQRRVVTLLTRDELKYRNPGATAGGVIEISFIRAK